MFHAVQVVLFFYLAIFLDNILGNEVKSAPSKIATLSTHYTSQRFCNTTNSYYNLFNDPNAVMSILSVNPGLTSLTKISNSIYRGVLDPIHAPGLSIFQTIDFHISKSPNSITITVPGGAVKQTYEGIPFLVKVCETLETIGK